MRCYERDVQGSCEAATELFVVIGLGAADPVIEMSDSVQQKFSARLKLAKEQKQRHRIRSSGDGRDDTGIGTPQSLTSRETGHANEKRHADRGGTKRTLVPEGGLEPPTWRL